MKFQVNEVQKHFLTMMEDRHTGTSGIWRITCHHLVLVSSSSIAAFRVADQPPGDFLQLLFSSPQLPSSFSFSFLLVLNTSLLLVIEQPQTCP